MIYVRENCTLYAYGENAAQGGPGGGGAGGSGGNGARCCSTDFTQHNRPPTGGAGYGGRSADGQRDGADGWHDQQYGGGNPVTLGGKTGGARGAAGARDTEGNDIPSAKEHVLENLGTDRLFPVYTQALVTAARELGRDDPPDAILALFATGTPAGDNLRAALGQFDGELDSAKLKAFATDALRRT